MEQQLPHLQLSRFCKAKPEAVYDLLADLRTHTEWGGARQSREFRLISLDAPPGPAMGRVTWLMIPMYAGRGLRNLLTLAEQSTSRIVLSGSPIHTQEM